MSKSRKSVHRRGAESAEEGAGGADLRAQMVDLDKRVHASAKGITGLEVLVKPRGTPPLRIRTASQLYVIEVNANWEPGRWAKKERWVRLCEARDALMTAASGSLEALFTEWNARLASAMGKEEKQARSNVAAAMKLLPA